MFSDSYFSNLKKNVRNVRGGGLDIRLFIVFSSRYLQAHALKHRLRARSMGGVEQEFYFVFVTYLP